MAILAGSYKAPIPDATVIGPYDPTAQISVRVILRRPDLSGHLKNRHRFDHQQFAVLFSAAPDDILAVVKFADTHNLQSSILQSDHRSLILTGTVANFTTAFGVTLTEVEHNGERHRTRTGSINLPTEMQDIVTAVIGLDNRPVAKPHFRVAEPDKFAAHAAGNSLASPTQYTPQQIAEFYNFPPGDGTGQTLALIELGGGYKQSDLDAYFDYFTPKVIAIGNNAPTGDPNGPDGEVELDIEIAGALLPEATIAVYFGTNTDAGFLQAITTAIHDTTNKPAVISISWGGPESDWTSQSLQAFDEAFQAAAILGITVIAASGDNGSGDGLTDGVDHVDFPGSSPHVLCAGGTSILTANGKIISEVVWNDGGDSGASGGGVSGEFPVPSWQQGLSAMWSTNHVEILTERGVPDVAANADPNSGYSVYLDGTPAVVGGTSCVAPLWAALITRINQRLTAAGHATVGFANPQLYGAPSWANPITHGNNGDFAASPGWDACTGLGSPKGDQVAALWPPPPAVAEPPPATPPAVPVTPPVVAAPVSTSPIVLQATDQHAGQVLLSWTPWVIAGVNVEYLVEQRQASQSWVPVYLTDMSLANLLFDGTVPLDYRVVGLAKPGITISNTVTVQPT